jgi:hypothetical protein
MKRADGILSLQEGNFSNVMGFGNPDGRVASIL